MIAGATLALTAGLPFLIAGLLKSGYDLALWGWFRKIAISGRR
ncbi:hypothetical protein BH18ACT5_BH18ACT5_17920 [soil metagenome]